MKQTSVEWFYKKMKNHIDQDGDLLKDLHLEELHRKYIMAARKYNNEIQQASNKDESKILFDFFIWFRENGQKHIDKSIEKMIESYLNSK